MVEVLASQPKQGTQSKTFKEIHDYPPVMLIDDVIEFTRLGTVRAYELLRHPRCPTIKYGRKAVYRDDFIKFYLGFIGGGDT